MKIKWIGEQRDVPKVGLLTSGDIREVPNDIAKGLISQGLAIVFKKIKKGGDE